MTGVPTHCMRLNCTCTIGGGGYYSSAKGRDWYVPLLEGWFLGMKGRISEMTMPVPFTLFSKFRPVFPANQMLYMSLVDYKKWPISCRYFIFLYHWAKICKQDLLGVNLSSLIVYFTHYMVQYHSAACYVISNTSRCWKDDPNCLGKTVYTDTHDYDNIWVGRWLKKSPYMVHLLAGAVEVEFGGGGGRLGLVGAIGRPVLVLLLVLLLPQPIHVVLQQLQLPETHRRKHLDRVFG